MKNTINTERMITVKKDTFEMKKETKEERMIAMKKTIIMISIIGILAGAAFCAVILRDGSISIMEAAAGFLFLALMRIVTMLAKRGKKEEAAEKTPIRPLPSINSISSQGPSAWKPAA